MNGFYAMYFTGTQDSGYALLIMQDGMIAGADPTGAVFDGHYALNPKTETYDGTIRVVGRIGSVLVTGEEITPDSAAFSATVRLPKDFDNGQIIRVETERGPINVKFHKLRGLA